MFVSSTLVLSATGSVAGFVFSDTISASVTGFVLADQSALTSFLVPMAASVRNWLTAKRAGCSSAYLRTFSSIARTVPAAIPLPTKGVVITLETVGAALDKRPPTPCVTEAATVPAIIGSRDALAWSDISGAFSISCAFCISCTMIGT